MRSVEGSIEVGGGSMEVGGDLHGGLQSVEVRGWRPPRTFTDLHGAPYRGPWMSMKTTRLFYVNNN